MEAGQARGYLRGKQDQESQAPLENRTAGGQTTEPERQQQTGGKQRTQMVCLLNERLGAIENDPPGWRERQFAQIPETVDAGAGGLCRAGEEPVAGNG